MNSDDRPYLLGATVPASEYVERHALTQYVWKYHAEHLTSLERRVGSYSVPILGSDQEPKIQGLWRKLNARYGEVPDIAVVQAMCIGRNEFKDNVCDRLLSEHNIVVNRCPACARVLRSPRARQCSWCKHKWHHSS